MSRSLLKSQQPQKSQEPQKPQKSQEPQKPPRSQQSQTRLITFLSVGFLVLLLGLVGALLISSYSNQSNADTASDTDRVPVVQPPAPANETTTGSNTGAVLRLVQSEEQSALEIWVEGVSGFYALDMEIQFDPSALQVIDADPNKEGIQIEPGEAPAPDFVATNSVDQAQGRIHYVVTQLAPREGFSGRGLVGRIAWQGTFDQASAITFEMVTLVDENGQPIEATLEATLQN